MKKDKMISEKDNNLLKQWFWMNESEKVLVLIAIAMVTAVSREGVLLIPLIGLSYIFIKQNVRDLVIATE